MPILIGILKGAVIGGGLGAGYYFLGLRWVVLGYLLFGLIGALVGVVAGKPFWRHETIWTVVFKAVFGFVVCLGLYALVHNTLGDFSLSFISPGVTITSHAFGLGALVGIIYGVFVEWDDSREDKPKK